MFLEVDLDTISEGMTLAKPVFNKVGQVMIAQDVAVTSKHINILKIWGIKKVEIVVNNDSDSIVNESDSIVKKKQRIMEILGWEVDNDFLDEIIELAALSKYTTN